MLPRGDVGLWQFEQNAANLWRLRTRIGPCEFAVRFSCAHCPAAKMGLLLAIWIPMHGVNTFGSRELSQKLPWLARAPPWCPSMS